MSKAETNTPDQIQFRPTDVDLKDHQLVNSLAASVDKQVRIWKMINEGTGKVDLDLLESLTVIWARQENPERNFRFDQQADDFNDQIMLFSGFISQLGQIPLSDFDAESLALFSSAAKKIDHIKPVRDFYIWSSDFISQADCLEMFEHSLQPFVSDPNLKENLEKIKELTEYKYSNEAVAFMNITESVNKCAFFDVCRQAGFEHFDPNLMLWLQSLSYQHPNLLTQFIINDDERQPTVTDHSLKYDLFLRAIAYEMLDDYCQNNPGRDSQTLREISQKIQNRLWRERKLINKLSANALTACVNDNPDSIPVKNFKTKEYLQERIKADLPISDIFKSSFH
jgi:hypothetical protein